MRTVKNKIYYCLSLLLAMGLWGCEATTDWELSGTTPPTLVVESILTDQEEIQSIKLSLSFSALNDTVQTVDDATVQVFAGNESFAFFPDPITPGNYLSNLPFAATTQTSYELNIFWEEQNYTATANMGFVSAIEDIRFDQVAQTDSFRIERVAPPYHPIEQAYFELELDWRHIIPSDSSQAKLYFYTFNVLQTGQFLSPTAEEIIFPRGTIIHETKYGIDEDFGNYLRSMVSETLWQGGLNDDNSSTPIGNISNGGLGYFAVCQVLTKTVIVE